MRQCDDCGADLPPGEECRREEYRPVLGRGMVRDTVYLCRGCRDTSPRGSQDLWRPAQAILVIAGVLAGILLLWGAVGVVLAIVFFWR